MWRRLWLCKPHPNGYEFVSRSENMDAAKGAGITIGTSHCEPMLRNNCYWKKEQGVWDYTANKSGIDTYWKWSVDNYGDYNCLWTIGIRGIHDGGMRRPRDAKARINILEEVFAAQKGMLGPERPTVFCPYKEVLPLYDAGLKVPEDTTLLGGRQLRLLPETRRIQSSRPQAGHLLACFVLRRSAQLHSCLHDDAGVHVVSARCALLGKRS